MFKSSSTSQKLQKSSFAAKMDQQLRNNHCHRCGGLMVGDYCLDVISDTGEVQVAVMKCFACGELIDQRILENRRQPHHSGLKGIRRRRVFAVNPQGLTHRN